MILADRPMHYISVKEFAQTHGLAERIVRNYYAQGKIAGTQMVGKTWSIRENLIMF